MGRRRFLKLITTVPVLAATAALVSPLLRFLKPNVEKFKITAPTALDAARGEPIPVATLKEVSNPWDYKYFVFTQKYPQYTPEGFKAANVPGVVIRLPTKITLYDPTTGQGPLGWARDIGKTPKVTESDIIVFSRICPHQGATVNSNGSGFTCPQHGAQFNASGTWIGGQRTSNMQSLSAQYDAGTDTLTITG